jgi:hypothetical protein
MKCLHAPLLLSLITSLVAADAEFTVHPDQPLQLVKGIGFEIQSDSIGSGNHGLPEEPISVPHDLVPSERERLASEMLRGFRYCRLAGGLYWRGLDSEKKQLQPRWPEQLAELKQLLDTAGVEGLSFEYWSPAPFWKANGAFFDPAQKKELNRLRCLAPGFDQDPIYKGDTNRFLEDFSKAVVADIATLRKAGIKVSMWGLQNEPDANGSIYSTCHYPESSGYVSAYKAVAGAIRKSDPSIFLFADTCGRFPKLIGPGMTNDEVASLVDAYAVHTVGSSADSVKTVHEKIARELPARPWFQNEYEYLTGGATPERCLNTVAHIMNSFQIAGNPTWFWIHALKPLKNAEASGYSLGFWKSLIEPPKSTSAEKFRRWVDGPEFTILPEPLGKLEMVTVKSTSGVQPKIGYNFMVNQPVTVYLLTKDSPGHDPGKGWVKTEMTTSWNGGRDVVYKGSFPAGKITVPAPSASGDALSHAAFVEPSDSAGFKAQIGMNLPIQIRSQALELERKAASIQPGHWIFNPYNWNAVGSFVKHMPWDSRVVGVGETIPANKSRILAYKKPDGKLTIVLANRTPKDQTIRVETGLKNADTVFKGYRYTPDEAGPGTRGVEIGKLRGGVITPTLKGLSWEFWEQQ